MQTGLSEDFEGNSCSEIEKLLSQMTLKEKISQLGSIMPGELLEDGEFSEEKALNHLEHGIGHITKPGGESGFAPDKTAYFIEKIQTFLREKTRLGIPAMVHEECLSGYMGSGGTAYPQIIGLASSWNPDLVKRITNSIRGRIQAIGAHQVLAPVLDVAHDLRWGRVEEIFGEDPYLVAALSKSYVKGLQGQKGHKDVYTTLKHFGGHGKPEGGRNHCPVNISRRELRENFLFPFEAVIREQNVQSVMSAYHEIDGVPCTCSKKMLTDILRNKWGFNGFVISDGHSIKMLQKTHSVAEDKQEAGVMAIKSGVDLEGPTTECFGELLHDAVQNGSLAESTIDRSVRRHLESKYRKGLFDSLDSVDEEKIEKNFGTSEREEFAREAGHESIVLLKNENGLLPLSRELESVAVIGPNADSKRNLLGDYAFSGHMEGEKSSDSITTVLEGVKDKVSEDTKVFYAEGSKVQGDSHEGFDEAIKAANNSNLVISVVGGKSGFGFFPPEEREENFGQTSGEGNDRTDLKLPGVQRELLQEIYQTDTPMIAILLNGRPLSINWIHENLPAVLEAWLPGEEGGNAIADVLFGDYNPGGKLPVTVPKNVGQTPLHYRRKPISKERRYVNNDNRPLYPFGFGLSYTDFDYSDLSIVPRRVEPAKNIEIACNLTNTGDASGAEVVQLYIRDEYASITRPERELKGFEKINLDPGEKKRVSFKLPADLLGFYDRNMDLVVEPGEFKVMIGSSSEDIRLKGNFEVKSERKIPASERNYFTKTSIE